MRDHSTNRLVYLDSFRGLAIAMVVATHALGYSQLDHGNAELIGFLSRTIAVPVFFLVDGFLFVLGHQGSKPFSYGAYVAKSARRLLLPWVAFSLLYCALRLFFEYMDNTSTRIVYGQSWRDILLAVYLSSFSSQMYFLLSLFFIRAASQITHIVLRTRTLHRTIIAMAYIAFFHTIALQSWFLQGLDPLYHALWGMQFYLVGLALPPLVPLLTARGQWLSVITIGAGFLVWWFVEGMALFSQFLLLFGCYLLFLLNHDRLRFLSTFGRRSMGIYLLHIPLVMKVFSLALARFVPTTSTVFFILLAAATLCSSAFLTQLILQHPYGRAVLGESSTTPGHNSKP